MPRRIRDEFLDPADLRGLQANGATADVVLLRADVPAVAAALKSHATCPTWKQDVYGRNVRVAKQSYMLFRLAGHPWSHLQTLTGNPVTHALARHLSATLDARAIHLQLSDTASWLGYALFDAGRLVELLEDCGDHHNDASHLSADLLGDLKVRPTGRGIFGSALRRVAISRLKTPAAVYRFVDDFFRAQDLLAPVAGDWTRKPGPVTLDLPGFDPDQVDRLDILSGGPLAKPIRPRLTPEQQAQLRRIKAELSQSIEDARNRPPGYYSSLWKKR
jgi:hypothetical protein